MHALLQNNHPNFQTILVGKDTPNVSYGKRRDDNEGWLTSLRKKHGNRLDWSRIHCLGLVKHSTLRKIYQISSAHVYLSYPFVLSWSMLEAMSAGCLVIGSDTEPVKEVIEHGHNGLLVPFKDHKSLSETLLWVLNNQKSTDNIRKLARKTIINKYELKTCVKKQLNLIENLA